MKEDGIPPQVQLLQAVLGVLVGRGIAALASLGIPDQLAGGPRHYSDLASAAGVEPRALNRLLRLLTSVGMFDQTAPGTYGLNAPTEFLRSDHPESLGGLVSLIGSKSHWLPFGHLDDVLKTGRSGARHAFGTDIFSWFQREENAEEWEIFNRAMTSFTQFTAERVASAVDFSKCRKIVDVGGGRGVLLSRVLEKAPAARGVLFDLPGVVAGATSLDPRVERVGGSFFESVPAGADTYLLKHIIHDWDDSHSTTILGNIAKAMDPGGQVLVIEDVMPEGPEPHPAKLMDVAMLAMTEGGCERTPTEFSNLFRASGLRLAEIIPTGGPVCVVRGVKA